MTLSTPLPSFFLFSPFSPFSLFPLFAPLRPLFASLASHDVDYLLTWNCRHIDNAATKPLMRSICAVAGYQCPEICTPLELLPEDNDDVP